MKNSNFLDLLTAAAMIGALAAQAQTLTVTTDLQLWLKADAGVTTNAAGGVLQWDDQSGNLNHAVQGVDTQAPSLVTGALNSQPVVRFDGEDDFLDVVDSESLSFTGDLTTFFVIRFDDFGTFRAVWAKTVANLPAPTDFYALPGSGVLRAYRGDGTTMNLSSVDTAQALRVNTYLVLGVQIEGEILTHYLNAQPNGSGMVNTNTADGNTALKIGTRADGATRLRGDMAELLIYSRSLSGLERSNVFNYLQTKYNLLNLPPAVTLSSSPVGPNVNVGDLVTLTASPTDPDGMIARVEFTANGVLIGTAFTPPYAVRVTMDSAGAVAFSARAVDNKDGVGTSETTTLTAGPAGPTTLPVTGGLQLWMKADAGTTVGAGDVVTEWADQSGSGNHGVQVDPSMAPTLVPNVINGLPVLRFDGVNDFLDVADSDSLSITGDIATFFVLNFADFTTFRAVWGKTAGPNNNLPAPTDMYALPNNGRLRLYRGNGTSTGIAFVDSARPFPTGSFILGGFDATGTAITHFLGGAPNGGGVLAAPLADADTALKIGTRTDFVTRFKGDMAELLIYNRAPSLDERRALQRYLAEKYGLPGIFTPINARPTVRITGPSGLLQAPGMYSVTVEAMDADGAVAAVQIFANGVLLATDTSAPYSATLELPYGGQVVLSANATDNLGVRTTAASVTLCIQGPGAPAGLIGYWPLNGNGDATIGNDGVLVNGPVVAADRTGAPGGALAFDATQQQRVEVPGGGGLSGLQQGTISLWVKWVGTQDGGFGGSFGAVLGRQADGAFSSDIINLNNSDPNIASVQWRHNNANVAISGTALVANDSWRHIAVTFTPTNSQLFVDGFADGSGGGGPLTASATTPLAIGAWTGGGGSYFTGSIDDVAIWNRVLSTMEIQDLAAQFNTPLNLLIQPDCVVAGRTMTGIEIRWGSGAVLEAAPSLDGPWGEVQNAISPYSVPQGETQQFFRLRSQ